MSARPFAIRVSPGRESSARSWGILVAASVSLALGLILVLILAPLNSSRVVEESPAQALGELDAGLPHMPLPAKDAAAIGAIVTERLRCFSASRTLAERERVCAKAYWRAIIGHAHETLRAGAGLKEFMNRSDLCPAVYNICRGEAEGTERACFDREIECLAFALDRYRFGSQVAKPLR